MKTFNVNKMGTSVLVSRIGEKIDTLGAFTDEIGREVLLRVSQKINLEGTGKLLNLYTRDYLNYDFKPEEHMGYAQLPETICLLEKFFSGVTDVAIKWMNNSKPIMCASDIDGFRMIVGADLASLNDSNMRIKIRLVDAEEIIRASLYRPIFSRVREVH